MSARHALPQGLRASARGMTLIEVLISLVILSLGILAVIGLQLISKRNNADAGQRTVAAQLAYNIIEKMRNNSQQDPPQGTGVSTALSLYVTSAIGRQQVNAANGGEPAPACTAAAPCTPTQLALHDLWQWEQQLDGAAERIVAATSQFVGGLVSPSACIAGPATAGTSGFYTVTIVWRGTVKLPPLDLATNPNDTCARDPQPDGTSLYSDTGSDNVFRRTVAIPFYIYLRS